MKKYEYYWSMVGTVSNVLRNYVCIYKIFQENPYKVLGK
jgi:hypothetical protein